MEGWERVLYIMENEGLNKNSFSMEIGLNSNVTITSIINKKRNPQRETFEKIHARFPQYNFEWLINGKGEIFDKDINTYISNTGTGNIANTGNASSITYGSQPKNTKIKELYDKIIFLEKIIEQQEANLKSKDEIIELLKMQLKK